VALPKSRKFYEITDLHVQDDVIRCRSIHIRRNLIHIYHLKIIHVIALISDNFLVSAMRTIFAAHINILNILSRDSGYR
jgi:hypothetical protein